MWGVGEPFEGPPTQGKGAGWGTHRTWSRLATSEMVEVAAGGPWNAYTGGGE